MYCSFCGKSDSAGQVNYVVCGQAVYICDECIGMSVYAMGEVIAEQRKIISSLEQIIKHMEVYS